MVQVKKEKTQEKVVSPSFLDRAVGTVEDVAGRLSTIVSTTVETITNQAIQKLFGLLLLGMGIVFFLSGGATLMSGALGLPGSGQMIIGVFILLVTSLFIVLTRKY